MTKIHVNLVKISFLDKKEENNRIGWTLSVKLINVGYGIRTYWLENCQKFNKRTPTSIR